MRNTKATTSSPFKGTAMTSPDRTAQDPWLLTPGPLTTSLTVKQAMLHDWGSRDTKFIAINRRVRDKLVALAGGTGTHVCVPMQGSGTFAVEGMLGSFVPATGKLLILAMSAFGALPLDAREVVFDALAASSNKCLEGVPGLGFVICSKDALDACKGNSPSLSLDLFDQFQVLEKTGQWRFTPPIHCIVAFDQAIQEHEAEGGVAGRGGRYRNNCCILVEGMRKLGFETLLPDRLQAPIIVTFHMPADPKFIFQTFYDRLRERGFVIYPGKLTVADSFRIGCIGRLGEAEMNGALEAVRAVMAEMGVLSGAAQKCAANA